MQQVSRGERGLGEDQERWGGTIALLPKALPKPWSPLTTNRLKQGLLGYCHLARQLARPASLASNLASPARQCVQALGDACAAAG